MSTPNAAYLLDEGAFAMLYGKDIRSEISKLTSLYPHHLTTSNYRQHLPAAATIRYLFSGWGMQQMDEEFLKKFPQLEIVFYAAGSIRCFITDAAWERGIRIVTAQKANSIPVAEFTLSQILYCLKGGWQYFRSFRQPEKNAVLCDAFPGTYRSTIGLLSLGAIAQLVVGHLKNFGVDIIAYDPVVDPKVAEKLGVKLVSLEEVFRTSDVVSCHLPNLPVTEGILKYEHFAAMKPYTSFINTGRGAVVHEPGLIQTLRERPDLIAVLDVTHPEPPVEGSPFYTLPNVILTPHIAGSRGPEGGRHGKMMLDEFQRFLAGQPLQHEVTRQQAAVMA